MAFVTTDDIAKLLYASTNFLSSPIEDAYKPLPMVNLLSNNWTFCIAVVVSYLVIIFGGRKIMENYKPFDLQMTLAMWNGLLCLFSFIGMCRTVS